MRKTLLAALAAAVALLLVPATAPAAGAAPDKRCGKGLKHKVVKGKHRCVRAKKPKPKPKPKPPVAVQLLGFNDFHGNLLPPSGSSGRVTTSIGSDGKPVQVDAGGAEYLGTHLKALRATNPSGTIVTSSGDLIGASPLLSGLFHDEPTIEVMNALGLNDNGVGNHEFDEGAAELLRMQYGGCHSVDGCQDGTPFPGALFQFLAANVYVDEARTRTLLPPYEIRSVRGVKVGLIGVATDTTPTIVTPAGVAGLHFADEAETINKYTAVLKRKGVHAIVVLLHEGGFQDGTTQTVNTCQNLKGAVADIVPRLDPDVDVVLSAHTHQAYNCRMNGKLVTSAASFGRLITRVQLRVRPGTNQVVSMSATNVVVTRDVAKDAAVTSIIERYQTVAAPIANRVVGRITADITRTQNAAGESALGDVIADAQLEATARADFGGAVIAFMNSGGIRADLVYNQQSGGEAPGEVTYGELFTVQPFANTLVVKACTGAQVKAVLEQQFDNPQAGQDRILQVSRGFTYSYNRTAPAGSRVDPASIRLNGAALDPAATYRVTMNSFLASGGDGFTTFTQCTSPLGGDVDVDALARYMGAHSPVPPGPQDRIVKTG